MELPTAKELVDAIRRANGLGDLESLKSWVGPSFEERRSALRCTERMEELWLKNDGKECWSTEEREEYRELAAKQEAYQEFYR